MKANDWLYDAENSLRASGVESAHLDAQLLLEFVLDEDRTLVQANNPSLNNSQQVNLAELLNERLQRRPLAYVLGSREFYGHKFMVDERVLVPRPETEDMVTEAINVTAQSSRVLELGTGSGAIALSLKLARPDLAIAATDISREALEVAEINAQQLGAGVELVQSDLFSQVEGTFDLILANLPYVPEGARRQAEITHEPEVSLFSGADGLEHYRRFFSEAPDYLADSATAVVEFSPTQFAALQAEFGHVSIHPLSEYIYTCSFR